MFAPCRVTQTGKFLLRDNECKLENNHVSNKNNHRLKKGKKQKRKKVNPMDTLFMSSFLSTTKQNKQNLFK